MFSGLPVSERIAFCFQRRLRFACVWAGHPSRECRRKKESGIEGCKLKHHPLIHEYEVSTRSASTSSHSARSSSTKVALGVTRLGMFDAEGRVVLANVMYDEDSDHTLFREGFVKDLRVGGSVQEIKVRGTGGVRTKFDSKCVKLTICTYGEKIDVIGSTLPVVTDPVPVINWRRLHKRWRHLKDLPLQSSVGRIDILLGLDYAHLSAALERLGGEFEPVASRSRLGLMVRGVIGLDERIKTAKMHSAFAITQVGDASRILARAEKGFCKQPTVGG